MFEQKLEEGSLEITWVSESDVESESNDDSLTPVDSYHTITFNQLEDIGDIAKFSGLFSPANLENITLFGLEDNDSPDTNTINHITTLLSSNPSICGISFEQCWIDSNFINALLDKFITRLNLPNTPQSGFFTSISQRLKFTFYLPIFTHSLNHANFIQKIITLLPHMDTFNCTFLIDENNEDEDTTEINLRSFTQALPISGRNLRHLELNYIFLDSLSDLIEFIKSPQCQLETLALRLNSADGSLAKFPELISAILSNPHLKSVTLDAHSLSDAPHLTDTEKKTIINNSKQLLPTHHSLEKLELLGETFTFSTPSTQTTNDGAPASKKQKI